MKNLRIGGSIILLIGISLYFLAGENLETIAGFIAGAGFCLIILSFLKRSAKSS